jgi:hypothetical protein
MMVLHTASHAGGVTYVCTTTRCMCTVQEQHQQACMHTRTSGIHTTNLTCKMHGSARYPPCARGVEHGLPVAPAADVEAKAAALLQGRYLVQGCITEALGRRPATAQQWFGQR